ASQGFAIGDEPEERAYGGQPTVSRADGVLALRLEVMQEREHLLGGQFIKFHRAYGPAPSPGHEPQVQPPGSAVRQDRVPGTVTLFPKPFMEEGLGPVWERRGTHVRSPNARSAPTPCCR